MPGLGKNAQVIRHRLERIAELYAFLAIQIVNMVLLVVNIVIYPDSVLRSHSCNAFKNWKSLYSSELRQYWPSHYCFWITADGHGIIPTALYVMERLRRSVNSFE
jgi:hypothetical protein